MGGVILTLINLENATAQVAPTLPDILVANTNTTDLGFLEPNLIDDVTVNCDMLTNAADGTPIKAIAWDERGRSIRTHLYFEDGQGNVAIQNIDNPIIGKRPDIVLGDDIRFPGVNYRAAVIYVAADDRVKIRFYTLTNIGTPGFTATADALEITLGSNKQLYAHDTDPQPHIDMWSDANNRITDYIGNNLHGMWEWVATWSEPNGGVSYYNNVWYAHGHINNSIITIPASLSGTIATVHKDRCKMSDVACYTDITTGQKIAAFVYCTPYDPNYMVVTELDMTTSGSHFVSAMTVLNSAWAFFPRIESMSQYHPWIEPAKWQVVVSASVGSPFNPQIPYGYNTRTGSVGTLLAPAGFSTNSKSPCVSGGLRFSVGAAEIGNRQYTGGYYPWSLRDLYAVDIDAGNGLPVSFATNWYQVNTNPLGPWPPDYYCADASKSFALSTCSNTGEYLLSAWYDGRDNGDGTEGSIWMKLSPNASTVQFKTTNIAALNGDYRGLYPNPATNSINLKENTDYSIYNLNGTLLMKGTNNNKPIDINELATGMYLLQTSKGTVYKFSKQ